MKIFLTILLSVVTLCSFAEVKRDRLKHALVIMDVHDYRIKSILSKKEIEETKKLRKFMYAQIEAIKIAVKFKIPIILISDIGLGPANVHDSWAKAYSKVKIIGKTDQNMFSTENFKRSELINYLDSENIGALIILGADGGTSIQKSIIGAMNQGYDASIYKKATADFRYDNLYYPYDLITDDAHDSKNQTNCKGRCRFSSLENEEDLIDMLENAEESARFKKFYAKIKQERGKINSSGRKQQKSRPSQNSRDQEREEDSALDR